MLNSSYLDMNRDLKVLQKIIEDYEAQQSMKKAQALIGITFARPYTWQPAYRHPVALAS